jgi:hypothetical protein
MRDDARDDERDANKAGEAAEKNAAVQQVPDADGAALGEEHVRAED